MFALFLDDLELTLKQLFFFLALLGISAFFFAAFKGFAVHTYTTTFLPDVSESNFQNSIRLGFLF